MSLTKRDKLVLFLHLTSHRQKIMQSQLLIFIFNLFCPLLKEDLFWAHHWRIEAARDTNFNFATPIRYSTTHIHESPIARELDLEALAPLFNLRYVRLFKPTRLICVT